MFLLGDEIVYSASDLTAAAACEYALLRRLDERLGRIAPRVRDIDPMLERTARLGDQHEARVLAELEAEHGDGVLVLERPASKLSALETARDKTLEALRAGAPVVAQGAFFDGRFNGYADFLVRVPDEGLPMYKVLDSKLARHEKVTALLQIAAYADQLARSGIPVFPEAGLILGTGVETSHGLADIIPVYRDRRRRLEYILDTHHADAGPMTWSNPRFLACGRCEDCDEQVEATRDPLLVAGLRTSQRKRLREAGITTIDQLAVHPGPVEGLAVRTLDNLRAQAAIQTGSRQPDGEVNGVAWSLHSPNRLATLPPPSQGDIFFDFEGDPLWVGGDRQEWGLEYLFGVLEPDGASGRFLPFWAHNRAEEKQALVRFLDYVTERRRRYPEMHIYHYAAYEKSALLRLAGRHGTCEDVVDDLLREGVLVDLYSTVRHCLRVSQRSYSIKKLEPLYMGADLRSGDVTDAAASIVAYQDFCQLRDSGDEAAANALLNAIADYNRYDCLSTWRLRDWLLSLGAKRGVHPVGLVEGEENDGGAENIVDDLALRLLGLIDDVEPQDRSADQQAVALLAAAIGYHRRERKPFWWGHFDRLKQPFDEWADSRDCMVVDQTSVIEPWGKTGQQRNERRRIQLVGRLAEGSRLEVGSKVFCMYEGDLPSGMELGANAVRTAIENGEVVGRDGDDQGRDVLTVVETAPSRLEPWKQFPVALGPASPPASASIERAIRDLAEQVARSWPSLPPQPSLDLLRRLSPRLSSGPLPAVDPDTSYVDAITSALLQLDDSYVAVQGPPGTGKTYVGSHVVASLLRSGWRVGVVAQSHAVVENFLREVVSAGVPSTQVGKAPADGSSSGWTWTALKKGAQSRFLDENVDTGCVLGGTAWDFTNLNRVDPGSLDLLVIDEAGQFSLADTIAVSSASPRLLLLGDPQQLPQVSQGTHPEPVDGSALGWVSQGHDTLPPRLGYFLERSWRMHPQLCASVSELSYEGRLHSQEPETTTRSLDDIDPGILVVELDHRGNSTESAEEAEEVLRQVRQFLGRAWRDGQHERPLNECDILVVAPYNAQVSLIRRHLSRAGLQHVRVGTVDKFQGQEAPVVIVSMTASAVEDVPRGMSFLLSRNRLNVAVSRGMWCAVIVRSVALTDYLPATPVGLSELGAFLGLCSSRPRA